MTWITYLLLLAILVFLLGPREKFELFWSTKGSRVKAQKPLQELTSEDLIHLKASITESEQLYGELIEGAEKCIDFDDASSPNRTEYSVLYVHGYSASRQEINPVPQNIAKAFNANLYSTRLTGHGLDGDSLAKAQPGDWMFDIMEAWDVARQLGDKVIVMSTSTGGTLSTWLAQQPEVQQHLSALVMVSPNFQPNHWAMPLFLWPWAKKWIPYIAGDTYGWEPTSEEGAKYWTYRYPISAIHGMTALVKSVRKSPVENIKTPTLFLYSDFDKVVNARFTDAVARRWGANTQHRISVPPRDGDNNHVVTGNIVNPDTTDRFTADILTFLRHYVVTDLQK